MIPVDAQIEDLSLVADIVPDGGEPEVHTHVVLGRRDGSTVGGHPLEARVRPTLEVIAVDSPSHLRRVCDPVRGIAPIRRGRTQTEDLGLRAGPRRPRGAGSVLGS